MQLSIRLILNEFKVAFIQSWLGGNKMVRPYNS
jgi:hypothetical protein